jgi:hypothetical protein
MTESNEQAAKQLDDAIERQRAVPQQPASNDPALLPLLALAARLDHELPSDLPDPAFRARLGQQLRTPPPTVRRFFYDWRFGVAAAVLVIILLIVVIFGSSALSGDGNVPPARETVVSAMIGGEGTAAPGTIGTPRTVEDTAVFPPIDAEHVVLIPSATPVATATATVARTPAAEPTPGVALHTTLPNLPETAPTWLLTGPEQTQPFLETLIARTGITGQIEPDASAGQNAYKVVDTSGFAAIHWNQHDAYFRYDRGRLEPTPPPIRATTDPAVTAKDWLSEIGFDLTTIKYKESAQVISGRTIVRFDPINLPATALAPGLGVTLGVDPDGSIQFAEGFWLSLGQTAEVHLRDGQQMLADAEDGKWFSTEGAGGPLSLDITSAQLTYLLTRADDSSYLLQPVMAFGGTRGTTRSPAPGVIYVSAIAR